MKMRSIVIYSKTDKAGGNISAILRDRYRVSPVEYEKGILHATAIDFLRPYDLCIVASRHRSESGTPTLAAHSPGNFGKAEAGGGDRELGIAPALFLRQAVKILQERKIGGFEATLEATHHGPTSLGLPVMFVEVGSTEKEWADGVACAAAADAIKNLLSEEPERFPAAIGFGGGHYCRKFSSVRDFALGHICPKHNLHNVDSDMVEQMIKKTVPAPKIALVERKGLGKDKGRIMGLLAAARLETVVV